MVNGKWIMRNRELLNIDKTGTMESMKHIVNSQIDNRK